MNEWKRMGERGPYNVDVSTGWSMWVFVLLDALETDCIVLAQHIITANAWTPNGVGNDNDDNEKFSLHTGVWTLPAGKECGA